MTRRDSPTSSPDNLPHPHPHPEPETYTEAGSDGRGGSNAAPLVMCRSGSRGTHECCVGAHRGSIVTGRLWLNIKISWGEDKKKEKKRKQRDGSTNTSGVPRRRRNNLVWLLRADTKASFDSPATVCVCLSRPPSRAKSRQPPPNLD